MMHTRVIASLLFAGAILPATAAQISERQDAKTGWRIYTATAGDTTAQVVPAAGCNVCSITHRSLELLKTPPALADLPGVGYGTPILYPSPNRVRDAAFTFRGTTYRFPPNNGANFIHGLVHSAPWEVLGAEAHGEEAVIRCALSFAPGTEWHERFPFAHTLALTITVKEGAVRWEYKVENPAGGRALPFGFALHPWFLYQGSRAETYLTVPATHWMEAVDLLPTGKLVPLAEAARVDAREPRSLEGFVIDDVYSGMRPDRPVTIDFRLARRTVQFWASDAFTHLVVYTPAERPWFCVENQTCSTDAHNLQARGLVEESHLTIVEPGATSGGWVEYRFGAY